MITRAIRQLHYKSKSPERLYLYNYGDECVDVTGGWGVIYQSNKTLTKESDHLLWTPSSGTMQHAWIYTMNTIDFSPWSMLHIDFEDYITNGNTSQFYIWASTDRTSRAYNDTGKVFTVLDTNYGRSMDSYKYKRNYDFTYDDYLAIRPNDTKPDLSQYTTPYYLGIGHYSDYSQTGYAKIYEVWLE